MAVQGGDVSFKFTGDTSGLVAAVKEVAQQQQVAAGVAVKAASTTTAALESQRQATVAASAAVADAGVKYQRLLMAAGPLGGVLSKISPEAGAAASSIAGMTSAIQGATAAGLALETVVPAVAAVSAVVAAGAILWQSYNAEQERAAERAKKAAEYAATEADYVKRLDDAQYHLKATVGTLTEEEEKARVKREVMAQLAKDVAGKTDEQASALRGLASKTLYAREQEIEYAYAQKESAEALAKKQKEQAAAAAGTRDHAEALREATAQQKRLDEAMAEDARLNGQAQSAISALTKMQEDANASTLSGVEAENAALAAAQAKALEVYQAGVEAASGQVGTLTDLARDYEATRVALARASAKKIDAIHKDEADKATEEARRAAKEAAQVERQKNEAILSLAGGAHDALLMYADKLSKKNKDAARAAFAAAQLVAVSSALVNTGLAVTNALATVPYPAAPFVAAAAAVEGGLQVATILNEKPSFHAGGMLYPDEGNATLLRGEPVINRQAAARIGLDNPAAVADVNNGGAGGPTLGGVTVLRIGRLEAREIVRSDIAAGGLIVRTAKQAAANAGNPAGRTGRRPIA